jgi:hypothetical protein
MKKLEKQFKIVEDLCKPEGNVHEAFIEMTKLMIMFYKYLESKKNDS